MYPTDGTTTAFAYCEMGLAAFTYELGTQFFESCSYFENTIVPDNMPSLVYAIKVARTPYMTPAGPDTVNLALSLGATPPGIPSGTIVTLSATVNDTCYNNSNGTEPTQNIAGAEYYVDVPPWVGNPTPITVAPVDGSFNSTFESVTAAIDTTGLSDGQHTIFVRGRDFAGNWGAFSAIFLYIENTPCSDDNDCNDGEFCNGAETCGTDNFCQSGSDPCPGQLYDENGDVCVEAPVFEDDFESGNAQGWDLYGSGSTASTGNWEMGDPNGTISGSDQAQPEDAYAGSGCAFTAQNTSIGVNDVDGGVIYLVSPVINLSGVSSAELQYLRWFYNRDTGEDSGDFFVAEVSADNGNNWSELEKLDTKQSANSWTLQSFYLETSITLTDSVRVRFGASDGASLGNIIEAAIDNVEVWGTAAEPTCEDGIQNQGEDRIDCGGPCPACECLADPACDDTQYCNGAESCDQFGACQSGSDPCPDQLCDEDIDTCVDCFNEGDCDDGLFCNVTETCIGGFCRAGSDPCPGKLCDEDGDQCLSGPTAQLEVGTVTVGPTAVTVSLTNTYISPVVVCSVQYSNNSTPVVARVFNVTPDHFDVYLQNPSGSSVSEENVSFLVMEEGVWTVDGVNVEAQKYLSTVTDENNSWVGSPQSYGQSYTNPVVTGQVMSANDSDWSVFWCQGSSRSAPPSSSALRTGKTVCEDTDTTRASETVGFIVFEAGHDTIGGVVFEAFVGMDTVAGVTNSPPYPYTFNTPFASAPAVAVTTMAGVDGGNGGWSYAHASTLATTSTLNLSIDEDQVGDSERNHTTEQVGYVVFESDLVYP